MAVAVMATVVAAGCGVEGDSEAAAKMVVVLHVGGCRVCGSSGGQRGVMARGGGGWASTRVETEVAVMLAVHGVGGW
uniref:Uncharacterized protein n=1 Tax=Tanacetum cinerariifolium TaxID=118510 RepID=A0A699TKU5_TANCI|nr:hypothetical protein [Tanacetum cinerariifolium]